MGKLNEARRSWDLCLIIALSLVLALFIYTVPGFPGRIVVGLPFILFFPGYALIATLFPESKSLDLIERIALSFGLSIAIVPLIGFGLNYTPFGIRLDPVLWSLIAFNVILSATGIWRRSISPEPFLPFKWEAITDMAQREFGTGTMVDRTLSIVLVLAIFSSVVALTYVIVVPRQGEAFSEVYILGPGGKAEDYPNNLTAGDDASIIIGVANHNYRTINYTIEIWLSNYTYDNETGSIDVHRLYYKDVFNVELDHVPVDLEKEWTKQWEMVYEFNVTEPGSYKLWLFILEDSEPHLWAGQPDNRAGTQDEARFLNIIRDRDAYTLNLNLNVS